MGFIKFFITMFLVLFGICFAVYMIEQSIVLTAVFNNWLGGFVGATMATVSIGIFWTSLVLTILWKDF